MSLRGSWAYPLLLLAAVLWACIGVFPLLSYETDSQEFILGCEVMWRDGWSLPPAYSYEYRMHPLTMLAVVALKGAVPLLTCEQAYCLLTALSALAFLTGCVELVSRLTGAVRAKVLLAALLLPEMYAVAMYGNTAIPAAACFVWAFVAVAARRYWAGSLLLCVSPLLRVDVVAVYPAILPLLLLTGHRWKCALMLSVAYGMAVVAVSLSLFTLLRADVFESLTGYGYWNDRITPRQVLTAIFGFYSLAYVVLLPLGVGVLLRRRQWVTLLLVLLPTLSLHFVYREMGCAAKHYLYAAPFVILAGVYALRWLMAHLRSRVTVRVACAVALVLFLTLSVRMVPADRPWFGWSTMYCGGALTMASAETASGRVDIGIGAGQYVPTEDEYMIATSHLFYPCYIHAHKEYLRRTMTATLTAIDSVLATMPTAVPAAVPTTLDSCRSAAVPQLHILALSYASRAPILSHFVGSGFVGSVTGYFDTCTLTKGDRRLCLWANTFDDTDNSAQTLWQTIERQASAIRAPELYVIVNMPRYQHYLGELSRTKSLEKVTDVLYKYYKK